MIKLSITRIAVIGINYSFSWFKRTINYFLNVLSILHAYQYSKELPEVDKQLQLLFQYIDHASQKSHVEEVEQIQIKYSASSGEWRFLKCLYQ